MLIASLSLDRYCIPLMPSLAVARQRIDVRHGLVLSLTLESQHMARVEITPLSGVDETGAGLTGFSKESLSSVENTLVAMLPSLVGQNISALLCPILDLTGLASLAFGLSLLHKKLKDTWPPQVQFQARANQWVPLLCPAPNQSVAEMERYIRQKLKPLTADDHFVKIKVGQQRCEDEIRFIYQVLALRPALKLRLDANRAFSLQEAISFLACLPREAIDFIEEPCQDPRDNPALFQSLGIGYGLDETLNESNYHFMPQLGLRALVIKPMLLGSLQKLQGLIAAAHESGVRCILSSSLEADLGIADLAVLAAWLTPDEAPGLDTLASFSAPLCLGGTAGLNHEVIGKHWHSNNPALELKS